MSLRARRAWTRGPVGHIRASWSAHLSVCSRTTGRESTVAAANNEFGTPPASRRVRPEAGAGRAKSFAFNVVPRSFGHQNIGFSRQGGRVRTARLIDCPQGRRSGVTSAFPSKRCVEQITRFPRKAYYRHMPEKWTVGGYQRACVSSSFCVNTRIARFFAHPGQPLGLRRKGCSNRLKRRWGCRRRRCVTLYTARFRPGAQLSGPTAALFSLSQARS
jgi:hypothetical protein